MLLALALLATPARAADDAVLSSRLTVGALVAVPGYVGEDAPPGAVDLLLADRLRATLSESDTLKVSLLADARLTFRLTGGFRPISDRVRSLGLRLVGSSWTVDLGRTTLPLGSYRLVDGAVGVFGVGGGVSVGAWAGLAPDPYTTLPALRYGGGPIVTWTGQSAEVGLLGEVLAVPGGLDRLAAVAEARAELSPAVELRGVADVQAADGGARLADGTVVARFDPGEALRVDLSFDTWSALSYLRTEDRDPWLRRFALRSDALTGDTFAPQDAMDPTVYAQGAAHATWSPKLGAATRLRLDARARARTHADPARRLLRGDLAVGLAGVGRADLGLTGAAFDRGGWVGEEGGGYFRVDLDPAGRVALDTSADAVFAGIGDTGKWGVVSNYFDAWLDARLGKHVLVGAGYALSGNIDVGGWDYVHSGMARVTWKLDVTAREPGEP